MADSIGGSGGPKPPTADELSRPDVGFHDDKVGGQLKGDEAARQRAAGKIAQRRPQRLENEQKEVGAVSRFTASHRDDSVRQEARKQRALVAGTGRAPPKARSASAGGTKLNAADREMQRLEGRVALSMSTLRLLDEELTELTDAQAAQQPLVAAVDPDEERQGDAQQRPHPQGPEAETTALQAKAEAVLERMLRANQEARYQLQFLIAGGSGLVLSPDPKLTFRRIFERLECWPRQVPPGRTPDTEEDFDAFLAWVFAPIEHEGILEVF